MQTPATDVTEALLTPATFGAGREMGSQLMRLGRGSVGVALAFGQRNLQHQCLATAAGYVGSGVAHGGFLLLLERLGASGASTPWVVLGVMTGLETGLTAVARLRLRGSLSAAGKVSPAIERQLWRMMTATTGATTMQNLGLTAAAWGLSGRRAPAAIFATMTIVARIGEAGTAGMLQALGAESVTTLVPTPRPILSARQQVILACGESLWQNLGANLPALAGLIAARQLTGIAGTVLSAVVGTMTLAAAVSTLPTLLALLHMQRSQPPAVSPPLLP